MVLPFTEEGAGEGTDLGRKDKFDFVGSELLSRLLSTNTYHILSCVMHTLVPKFLREK